MLKTITIKKKNSIAQFYQKKEDCNLILTNESKFMNPGFWNRVHEHIISSTTLDSSNLTNSNKYNICQVKITMYHLFIVYHVLCLLKNQDSVT